MKESDQIELRSEKVRNIIGQIPPKIIRIGITVIVSIFFIIIFSSQFFYYDYTIKTEAFLKKTNEKTYQIIIKIPFKQVSKVKIGQKVIIDFYNYQNVKDFKIISNIKYIDRIIRINRKEGYVIAKVKPEKVVLPQNIEMFIIEETIPVNAEIYICKSTLLKKIMDIIL